MQHRDEIILQKIISEIEKSFIFLATIHLKIFSTMKFCSMQSE